MTETEKPVGGIFGGGSTRLVRAWNRLRAGARYRWQRSRYGLDPGDWDRVVRTYWANGRSDAVEWTTRRLVRDGLWVPESVARTLADLRRQGRFGDALAFFGELPEAIRGESDVEREGAAAYLGGGQSRVARTLARKALEKNPNDDDSYGILLLSLCAEGRHLEAARSIADRCEAALGCDWAVEKVLRGLAEKSLSECRSEARESRRALHSIAGLTPSGPLILGMRRRLLGDYDGAAAIFNQLLTEPERDPVPVRLEICRLALRSWRWHEHIDVIATVCANREAPQATLRQLEAILDWHATIQDFYRCGHEVAADYRVPDSTFELVFLRTASRRYQPARLDVALVGETLGAGGAEKVLCNAYLGAQQILGLRCQLWIQSLDPSLGHDFFLREFDLGREPEGACYLLSPPAEPASPFSWLPSEIARHASAIYEALRRRRPRVVHSWQDSTNLEVAYAALRAGVPKIVVHPHNMQPDLVHQTPISRSFLRAYRALLPRPEVHLICVSEASLADYLRWLGIERNDRHHVVHNGFVWPDAGTETAQRQRRAAARAGLGLDEGRFVVGGMFRAVAIKRPDLWLEVAKILTKSDERMMFVLFGEGPELPAMRREVARSGLGDRIRLEGTVRRAAEKCAAFDVLLHTSSSEGLPTVLLEAQFHGVPVVAAAAGGVPEALHESLSTAITDVRVEAFVEALERLARCPLGSSQRTALSRFVSDGFGVDRMVSQLARIYDIEPRQAAESTAAL